MNYHFIYNKKVRAGILVGWIIIICSISSCKKFLEVDLDKSLVTSQNVFSDDATATSAVTGMYHDMINLEPNFASGSNFSVTQLAGLSADELDSYTNQADFIDFERNSLQSNNAGVLSLWSSLYNIVYQANAVLSGLEKSKAVSDGVKKQLEGEAKFIRAFCHFYLVNLFGKVPLLTTADYQQNAVAQRLGIDSVYTQIIADLKDAETKLNTYYPTLTNTPSTERIRPNRWVAIAMLSRVYLYNEDWVNAELKSSEIISNIENYELLDNVNSVFLKNSREAIWQLRPVAPNGNTKEGYYFVINPDQTSAINNVLRPELPSAYESSDSRLANWIGTFMIDGSPVYFPYKYKIKENASSTEEYSMVFRLAEQYLIRAEARTMQNNLVGANSAESDINEIRERAGLSPTTATSQLQLIDEIILQRRLELFTEWGHRWFDLKRWDKATAVLSALKQGWSEEDVLYPVPIDEINKNKNLNPQNSGY